MSDVYNVNSTTTALSSATVKTLLQVQAPSTSRVKVNMISVSFDGAASATPAVVDVLRQTTAGTGTSVTPTALVDGGPASASTCLRSHSAEPTPSSVIGSWFVSPNGGLFVITYAPGEEPVVAASGRIGLRVTVPVGCNAIANITFSE